jgi:hypothetical protein
VVKNMSKAKPSKTVGVRKRRPKPRNVTAEERILRDATKHLILKHGGLLVATAAREQHIKGLGVWIITVTLRYPTGHEGYIGELLYDGDDFTFLTPLEVRKERVRQIDADPALQREWNEYRMSLRRQGIEESSQRRGQ